MMRHCYTLSILAAALIFVSGCGSNKPRLPKPEFTSLETRAFQTHTFEASLDTAMKATVNVLQDNGFIVTNAVPTIGLITAQKQVNIEDKSEKFFSSLFWGSSARWSKIATLEANANISELNNQSRVRLNFQYKSADNQGLTEFVQPIDDEAYYEAFFANISKSIFLYSQKI